MGKRRRHSAQFKFQVALEAAKGTRTLNELASEYGLHPSQISEWKHCLLDGGASVFSTVTARQQREQEAREFHPPFRPVLQRSLQRRTC